MYQLGNGIIVRKEFFGALIFSQKTGRVVTANPTALCILHAIHNKLDPVIETRKTFNIKDRLKLNKDIETFVGVMLKRNILEENGTGRFISIEADAYENQLNSPRSIFWECADVCNLGTCIHCYAYNKISSGEGKYTFSSELSSTEENILTQAIECGVFTIDIGGGEPLLNPRLPFFIANANKAGIRCNIATNLNFGSSYLSGFLSQINWDYNNLQISLDGLQNKHDVIRNREGCFNQVISNFKMLHDFNIPININCTLMQVNYKDLPAFLDFLETQQITSARFVRVIASGRGNDENLLLNSEQYRETCLLLKETRNRRGFKIKADESFLFLEEGKKPVGAKIPWLSKPFVGCGAGRTLCSISHSGDVYPCAYIFGDEYLCGNINENKLLNIWHNSKTISEFRDLTDIKEPCESCEYLYNCGGGCRAYAIGVGRSIHAFDKGCWKS